MADLNTEDGQVTEAQADDALQQIIKGEEEQETVEVSDLLDTSTEQPAEAEVTEEVDTEEVAVKAVAEEEEEGDDVESLRARVKTMDEDKVKVQEEFDSRLSALQERSAASEKIIQDRYLRKATSADRARKSLMASLTEEGVDRAEVERVIGEIEGTMNSASQSYSTPQPSAAYTEDQALALNNFLNEKGMTREEAETFGTWISTKAGTEMSPTEQAVAGDSISGFLHLAHSRWKGSNSEADNKAKTDDAVQAARSVKRTQREAARAASSRSPAPKKQPANPEKKQDLSELSSDDVAALVRLSVTQYNN